MSGPASERRLRDSINQIADQLCQAIDGQYDFHVGTATDDLDIQKLSVLSNFVLESVRRNIRELEQTRDQLEQRVAERTRRLDLIIQGANDGVWEWDLERDLLKVSERWLSMGGCQPLGSEFAPVHWLMRIHEQDRGRFTSEMLRHANGLSSRFSCEYRLEDGRGGFRWMVARGICDFDPGTGRPRLMAGTQSDITEQKFMDTATGLPNADYLEVVLDQRLARGAGEDFTISINLSPVQMHDPALARELLEALSAAGVGPGRLKVELTETAVMADPGIAVAVMKELRRAGVAVVLDDFGAGYSSLGYIRDLPLDQLKIDRSLVSGLDQDEEKRAILDMILTLCDRLHLSVVVEGIETELELACLLGMGAHIGQGFLFSKPLPASELLLRVPRSGLLSLTG